MSFSTPIAHAKWFVDDDRGFATHWDALADPGVLVPLAVGAAVVTATVLAARSARVPALPGVDRLASLAPRAPVILRVTLGLGLLGLSLTGRVWDPAIDAGGVTAGWPLQLFQAVLGAWLISGIAPAPAALGVLGLAELVALLVDPLAVIEAAHLPAMAITLLFLDDLSKRRAEVARGWGATALRVGLGIGLITVAFTEKLLVPGVTAAVIETRPELDVLRLAGLTSGSTAFIHLVGAAEVALGALLISGALAPMVSLGALVPFVATLPLFGLTELIGHLPIYGALTAVAVLAAGAHTRRPDAPLVARDARVREYA